MVRRKSNKNNHNKNQQPKPSPVNQSASVDHDPEPEYPPIGKPNGRKTAYTPELGDLIVEYTAEIGSRWQAYKLAGASRGSFCRWLQWGEDTSRRDYEVFRAFRADLDQAEQDFKDSFSVNSRDLLEKLKEEQAKIIFGKKFDVTETIVTKEGENEKTGTYRETTTTINIRERAIPPHFYARIMGNSDALETARALVELELVPPEVLDEVQAKLDDDFTPALHLIIRRYLEKSPVESQVETGETPDE